MVRFFIPGVASGAEAERTFEALAALAGLPVPDRPERVYSVRYTQAGADYIAAVGNPITRYAYPQVPIPDHAGALRPSDAGDDQRASGHQAHGPLVAGIFPSARGFLITFVATGQRHDDVMVISPLNRAGFPGG